MPALQRVSCLVLLSLLLLLLLPGVALAEGGSPPVPVPGELNGAVLAGSQPADNGSLHVVYQNATGDSLRYLLRLLNFCGYIGIRTEKSNDNEVYLALHLSTNASLLVVYNKPQSLLVIVMDQTQTALDSKVLDQLIAFYTQDLSLPAYPGDYVFPQFYASARIIGGPSSDGQYSSDFSPFSGYCWQEVYHDVSGAQLQQYMSDMLLCGFEVTCPDISIDALMGDNASLEMIFTNGDAQVVVAYGIDQQTAIVYYKPDISYYLLSGLEYGALPRLNIPGLSPSGTPGAPKAQSTVSPGDLVLFGQYSLADKKPSSIPWIVLDRKDGRVLLLSYCGLDTGAFHEKKQRVVWSDCSLRDWLNSSFLKQAFSSAERAAIQETAISTPSGTYSPPDGSAAISIAASPDTRDNVFLLSVAEVRHYFPMEEDRLAGNTRYMLSKPADEIPFPANNDSDFAYGNWLLRDIRGDNGTSCVFHVKSYGSIASRGQIHLKRYVIRPAIWVSEDYPFAVVK